MPEALLTALSRSGMLILVSTASAGASGAVETEIRRFLPTQRTIIPIDLDGSIRSAQWWPLIEGSAVSDGEPFESVLERIQHSVTRDEAGPANYTTGSAVARGRAGVPRRRPVWVTQITSRER